MVIGLFQMDEKLEVSDIAVLGDLVFQFANILVWYRVNDLILAKVGLGVEVYIVSVGFDLKCAICFGYLCLCWLIAMTGRKTWVDRWDKDIIFG